MCASSQWLYGLASLSKKGWEKGNRGLIEKQPGHAYAHTYTHKNKYV